MVITLEQLMQGKATKIKNKEYLTTESYVAPFIERMVKHTNEFIINVKPADQISLTKDGEVNFEDIIYNRVNIEAVLPDEYAYEGHKQVIGFVYALDTRKPVVKQYCGGLRSCCLNLATFDVNMLQVSYLEPETSIDYSFSSTCMEKAQTISHNLNKLSKIEFSKEQCFNELGTWIDRCINKKFVNDFGAIKLSESTPIEAYKNLFYNEKSPYFTKDNFVTGFDIYQSFTDLVSNGTSEKTKDFVNRFEKTILVGKIMGIIP